MINFKRLTFYGFNCAMHGAVEISTRWGTLCFRPTSGRGKWPWYLYLSPNATPWASTFAIGPGVEWIDRLLAPIRRRIYGLRYDTDWLRTPNYGAIKDAATEERRLVLGKGGVE